jgi:hypothetical protein
MKVRVATSLMIGSVGVVQMCGCVRGLLSSPLGPVQTRGPTASSPSADPWAWDRCLQENVRDGLVDYAHLAGWPEPLDCVLAYLASGVEPNDSGASRIARWINTYNALAMRAGLERYLATGGGMAKARAPSEDEYRFRLYRKPVTLVDVRHRLLAAAGQDARVILAMCPAAAEIRLPDRSFQADLLDRQLSTTAAQAVSNPELVRVDHENQTLWVADAIGRQTQTFVRWYERMTGAKGAHLFDALLGMADDGCRRTLNTAVGYRIVVRPPDRRLNVYTPPATRK